MKVASLRIHWSIPRREDARAGDPDGTRKQQDLWGYVQEDSGAEAFLLAVSGEDERWSGHEAFFITSQRTSQDIDSEELRRRFWPDVSVKGSRELVGTESFFDCSKAGRLLGWMHRDGLE
jgi:hypothetical protein